MSKQKRDWITIEECMECIKIQRILGNHDLADDIQRKLTSYIEGDIAANEE